MSLTIELSPIEEDRLRLAAKQAGVAPEVMATKLVSEHLPVDPVAPYADLDAKVRSLQTQSSVRLMAHTSIAQLYSQWSQEDAKMSEEECEAEDRFWEDIENRLIENPRSLRLRRAE